MRGEARAHLAGVAGFVFVGVVGPDRAAGHAEGHHGGARARGLALGQLKERERAEKPPANKKERNRSTN